MMRNLVWIAVTTLLALTIGACCTRPVPPDYARSRTYQASFESVWNAAMTAVGDSVAEVGSTDRELGSLRLKEFRFGPDIAHFHCLSPGWTTRENRGSGTIRVAESPSGVTVAIQAEFETMIVYSNVEQNWRPAIPTGSFETGILESIEAALVSASALSE